MRAILRWMLVSLVLFIGVETHVRADRTADLRAQAEAGAADAQYDLGFLYDNGYGVVQDYQAALTWYRKAAEQGHAYAQWNLGVMHAHGIGLAKDYTQAAAWYRKAAEQGHTSGQYDLGLMYSSGNGVPQDYVQALVWVNLAATEAAKNVVYKGNRDAFNAAKATQLKYAGTRATLVARMTPAQLTQAAEQGITLAQLTLGVMYGMGQGVAQGDTAAVTWHRKAAKQEHARAQYFLGLHYYKGQGVVQDYTQAVTWTRKAAEQGYVDAQYNLGVMYWQGQGVAQDYTQAADWYRKAAKQGHLLAQSNLAFMYAVGRGVSQDDKETAKWYRKVADQGDTQAQYHLAFRYYEGKGVPQDYAQAHLWDQSSNHRCLRRGPNRIRQSSRLYCRPHDARATRGSGEDGPRVETKGAVNDSQALLQTHLPQLIGSHMLPYSLVSHLVDSAHL